MRGVEVIESKPSETAIGGLITGPGEGGARNKPPRAGKAGHPLVSEILPGPMLPHLTDPAGSNGRCIESTVATLCVGAPLDWV